MSIEDNVNYELIELREQIQREYNEFVEMDEHAELTDRELAENFWSNAIVDYNSNHRAKVGFVINNGIVELLEY